MKRIAKDRVGVVYFKRWSRKNYAAFVSMRFNVLICFLKKSVVEASLFKVEKYIKRGEASEFQFLLTDGESKAPPNLPDTFILFLFSLLSLNWRGAFACSFQNDGKEEGQVSSYNSVLPDTYNGGAVSETRIQPLLFYPFIIYNYENQRIGRKNDDSFISRRCGDCRVPA